MRHAHAREPGLARGPGPVVQRSGVAVDRGGVVVVEVVHRAHRAQALGIEQPGEAPQLVLDLGLERGEEHERVETVEATRNRRAASHEVQGAADRGGCRHEGCVLGALAQPLGEDVAAQRDAHRVQRRDGVARVHLAQDPVGLVAVTRVVGARQAVGLAAAASEVSHHAAPAAVGRGAHQGKRVVAAGTAFESMEEHQQRRVGARGLGQREVKVDEVAIGRLEPLSPVRDFGPRHELGGDDRLRMPPGQPGRCEIAGGNQGHAARNGGPRRGSGHGRRAGTGRGDGLPGRRVPRLNARVNAAVRAEPRPRQPRRPAPARRDAGSSSSRRVS